MSRERTEGAGLMSLPLTRGDFIPLYHGLMLWSRTHGDAVHQPVGPRPRLQK